ncbi:nucleotidyltransferase family protein [Aeromonas veronii]|uniref:nucleotidyltransferase family protein n=1 Tax=Aeromonas veronii TaxID=654 RepID=UPI001E4270B1|nr:nucleotidyltransferase family protein [Aeromonas veronii]MCD6617256.1 nucleotidyltransferase family protein [Aeromonas veronii]
MDWMSKNWEKVVLSPAHSVHDALAVINEEALRVCLVVDDARHLLGVVTDGDVRRAILNNVSLTQSVTAVMNPTPITVSAKLTRAQLLETMRARSVLSLPVVDDAGKLIGLETWEQAAKTPSYDNPVFIMAGGFGTRLRPLTDSCPKPMLKVGDRPILETLLSQFLKAGFKNIYISTHYMPEQITDYFGDGSAWGANIRYVYEETPLGTGGALGLLPADMPALPLIMINGDVLTTVDFNRLLDFHVENGADATMCVREYDYQIPYGVITGEGNKITSMIEKPVHHFFVNAGIYVVGPHIVQSVQKGERVDMPTLLERHMQADKQVLMFPIHEYWLDIGRMEDFHRAQSDISSLGLHS